MLPSTAPLGARARLFSCAREWVVGLYVAGYAFDTQNHMRRGPLVGINCQSSGRTLLHALTNTMTNGSAAQPCIATGQPAPASTAAAAHARAAKLNTNACLNSSLTHPHFKPVPLHPPKPATANPFRSPIRRSFFAAEPPARA